MKIYENKYENHSFVHVFGHDKLWPYGFFFCLFILIEWFKKYTDPERFLKILLPFDDGRIVRNHFGFHSGWLWLRFCCGWYRWVCHWGCHGRPERVREVPIARRDHVGCPPRAASGYPESSGPALLLFPPAAAGCIGNQRLNRLHTNTIALKR